MPMPSLWLVGVNRQIINIIFFSVDDVAAELRLLHVITIIMPSIFTIYFEQLYVARWRRRCCWVMIFFVYIFLCICIRWEMLCQPVFCVRILQSQLFSRFCETSHNLIIFYIEQQNEGYSNWIEILDWSVFIEGYYSSLYYISSG